MPRTDLLFHAARRAASAVVAVRAAYNDADNGIDVFALPEFALIVAVAAPPMRVVATVLLPRCNRAADRRAAKRDEEVGSSIEARKRVGCP